MAAALPIDLRFEMRLTLRQMEPKPWRMFARVAPRSLNGLGGPLFQEISFRDLYFVTCFPLFSRRGREVMCRWRNHAKTRATGLGNCATAYALVWSKP
jgi:hypothetical protein